MRENSDIEVQKVLQIVELSGIFYIGHWHQETTDRLVSVDQQISHARCLGSLIPGVRFRTRAYRF